MDNGPNHSKHPNIGPITPPYSADGGHHENPLDTDMAVDPVPRTRSLSPAPSIYSLTQSIRDNSFMDKHGRVVNNHSDVYQLPADDEEIIRLDKQHNMFKAMRHGSNYQGPVREVLVPDQTRTKRILDLGCGSGAWAIEMAQEFPHCEVVGVDLVPIQTRTLPPNCRIEVDDINLGLEHFHDQFDFVHTRLISSGIRDYYGLLDHIATALLPFGLVLLQDSDIRIYDEHKHIVPDHPPGHPEYSWTSHYFRLVGRAARERRGHMDAASLFEIWLKGHLAFRDCGTTDCWMPIGAFYPFPKTREEAFQNMTGDMYLDDWKRLMQSVRPLLLDHGIDGNLVDEIRQKAEVEVTQKGRRLYMRMFCAWARKRS